MAAVVVAAAAGMMMANEPERAGSIHSQAPCAENRPLIACLRLRTLAYVH